MGSTSHQVYAYKKTLPKLTDFIYRKACSKKKQISIFSLVRFIVFHTSYKFLYPLLALSYFIFVIVYTWVMQINLNKLTNC